MGSLTGKPTARMIGSYLSALERPLKLVTN